MRKNTSSSPRNINPLYTPQTFFKKLLRHFGPQGWWPVTPRDKKNPVYRPHHPCGVVSANEAFEICLGAILTQNTSWSNVVTVLSKLKMNRLLRLNAVAGLSKSKMHLYFRSSGYFRQKSKRVKAFVSRVKEESEGDVKKFLAGNLGDVRKKLLSVFGIGPETADCILLYAAGFPIFVVDAYTRRVGARFGFFSQGLSYDAVQNYFQSHLRPVPDMYGECHALIVRLAKDFCRSKPVCRDCPVKTGCRFGRGYEEK